MTRKTKTTITPLRERMTEDLKARKFGHHIQRNHIGCCKRFAAYLNRSPDAATADDVRLFQLHLIESGSSICNRNRIMSGVKFLLRVALRRHDLAAEIYHLRESSCCRRALPARQIPVVMSPDEVKRLLAMAKCLHVQTMLSIANDCASASPNLPNRH